MKRSVKEKWGWPVVLGLLMLAFTSWNVVSDRGPGLSAEDLLGKVRELRGGGKFDEDALETPRPK